MFKRGGGKEMGGEREEKGREGLERNGKRNRKEGEPWRGVK